MAEQPKPVAANVLWNWASHICNVLVGFFVIRLLVGRLGTDVFASWILLSTILGYYGLANLGFDSSVVRYVSKYLAEGRRAELQRLLSASQVLFALIGLLIFAVGCLLGAAFAYTDAVFGLFRLPAEIRGDFAWLVAVLSGGVAISFLSRMHVAVLRGMDRWDLVNKIAISVLLLRTVGLVLLMGNSLVALGHIFAVFNVVSSLAAIAMAQRLLPESRITVGSWNRQAGGLVGRYGFVAFLNQIADLVRYQTDAPVIAHFLRIELLAYYNFGYKLLEYLRHFIGNIGWPLFPVFSRLEGKGDREGELRTYLLASKITAFLAALGAANLAGSGWQVIDLWVGDRIGSHNVGISDAVLLVLIWPWMLEMIQSVSANLLFGVGRHHYLARIHGIEAAVNLILTIILVPRLGVLGAALGTAVPMLATKAIFLPRYVCRYLGFSTPRYLLTVVAGPLAGAALLAVVQRRLHFSLQLGSAASLLAIVPITSLLPAVCGYFLYFDRRERRLHRTALSELMGWRRSTKHEILSTKQESRSD